MHAPHRSPLAAAGWMLAAVASFSLMDAGMKLLSAHYPPLQVTLLRGAASLPFVLVWVLASAGVRSIVPVRWGLHLLRGVLGMVMIGCFVYALRRMPLSTAYTLYFVAPLLVAALSVPLLGERVGPRRWTAIGIGLLGVLVVLRPTGQGMATLGGLAVLIAAACYAASAITVRLLAQRDSIQAMVLWFIVLLSLGAGVMAAPHWLPLQASDLWVIAGVGVSGSLAQVALTEAFRRGEASLIAPFEYSALIWGVCLDLALWQVLPDGVTWIGAGIIVVSGLYLLRREKIPMESEHP